MNSSWFGQRFFNDERAFAKLISSGPLIRHISAMLEQPALHPLGHIRYRHHQEPATALPFHQHPERDAGGELSLARVRTINLLIPFTPFDGTCADMQFVTQPLATLLPITTAPETQFGSFELDREPILRTYAAYLWRPTMQVGDVCIFRDGTLHRTYASESMTRQRTSIDLRIFDAADPISTFQNSPRIDLPART